MLQAKTDVFKGRVVQLAGRIVGIEESANGTIILARELPVEKQPVFGPAETNKPMKAFAVLYPGKVDSNALWYGNKFIVVAVAQGEKTLAIDGIPRTEPYVVARCMHVWENRGIRFICDRRLPSYNRWLLPTRAPNLLRQLISIFDRARIYLDSDLCSVGSPPSIRPHFFSRIGGLEVSVW